MAIDRSAIAVRRTTERNAASVGGEYLFRILRRWTATQAGGHVTTDEFISLAERISREQVHDLFDLWLFSPEKPAGLCARTPGSNATLRRNRLQVSRS